jgi:NodT family efflux transporter outer membrane factor (OMF) lipoprotein
MPLRQSSVPIALAALLLAGCAAIPTDQPFEKALAANNVGLTANAAVSTAPVMPAWWKALNDPQLNRLMADALAGNPTLAEAQARLRGAQASLGISQAGKLPSVGIDVDEQRERLSEEYIIPPPYGGSTVWMGTTQASLSWSLDLAGKQAALVDQTQAGVASAALDAEAARVTLSGAMTQAYVNLARAEQQVAIARDIAVSRDESLRLAQSRIRHELASQFDARAAETLLAEARQALVRAQGDRNLVVHAIAALAGHGADYYAAITPPSLKVADIMPVPNTVPADLLGRRPDLLAAMARIDAANAGRRVARADFFPNVDLKAFLGVQAIGLGALFTRSALSYGAGPAIHLPIFEGGRLSATYKGATAQIDVAIAQYNAQVLTAVKEAADALSAIQTAQADAEQQKLLLASLTDAVRLDQIRFDAGLGSRLDTITSGDRVLQARQAQINIDADGALRRIQLAVALGGGFNPLSSNSAPGADAGAAQ